MYIPQLGKYAESILENGSSSGRKLAKLQRIARQAVAALCALGGFKETIKIGSEVQVTHHCFPRHSYTAPLTSDLRQLGWLHVSIAVRLPACYFDHVLALDPHQNQ